MLYRNRNYEVEYTGPSTITSRQLVLMLWVDEHVFRQH
jgi:hypothetical protein